MGGRFTLVSMLVLGSVLLGCQMGTPEHPVGQPVAPADLTLLHEEAVLHDATKADDPAAYIALLDAAASHPSDPLATTATLAAIHALVWRTSGTGLAVNTHGIVNADHDALLAGVGALRRAATSTNPVVAGLAATALHDVALRSGDHQASTTWRAKSGCMTAALVAGPTDWPPLIALKAKGNLLPLDMPASLPVGDAFGRDAQFRRVRSDGCALDVNADTRGSGLRVVVADLNMPTRRRVFLSLTTSSAAILNIGDTEVINRSFAEGEQATTELAWVDLKPGRSRVVIRVAQRGEASRIRLHAWSDGPASVKFVTPVVGERAGQWLQKSGRVSVAPAEGQDARRLHLGAAAMLALGQSRRANHLLERLPREGETRLAVNLLRLRTIAVSNELPDVQRRLRTKALATSLLAACPNCWAGRLAQAELAREKEGGEGGLYAALQSLGLSRLAFTTDLLGTLKTRATPELTYVALVAHQLGKTTLSEAAYRTIQERTKNRSWLLSDLDEVLHRRSGRSGLEAACASGRNRGAGGCLRALRELGDLRTTLREMKHLRRLRGNPELLRDDELAMLLRHGELARAKALYQAMPAAHRSVEPLLAWLGSPDAKWAKEAFSANLAGSKNAPYTFEPAARQLGAMSDPTPSLIAAGAEMVQADRKTPYRPGAAVAVLRHLENYVLLPSGLLQSWNYDLRRLGGTSDVAAISSLHRPLIQGKESSRTLHRRIYKGDGRILDPDTNASGAQLDTDLTQLEAGDYVERISLTWVLPDDSGQLVVDTPDLMPLRASVREAQVWLETPIAVPLKVWAHSLLGKPAETRKGQTRVRAWTIKNAAPRRIETSVPPLEARVGLSFGTDSYRRIATGLAEKFESLEENDPYIARWLKGTLGEHPPDDVNELLRRLTRAIGEAIPQSDPDALSDFAASLSTGGQRETARRIIDRGTGSRTWVLHRCLNVLGVEHRIVVAEERSFSADPDFPPRVGRFNHPLIEVSNNDDPIWVDIDVAGPPLPPGRVSARIRGHEALTTRGDLVVVRDGVALATKDSVAIALRVDKRGNADGTIKVTIRSDAQQLSNSIKDLRGAAREHRLAQLVASWLPDAEVTKARLISKVGAWQVQVQAEVRIEGFAEVDRDNSGRLYLPGLHPLHELRQVPRVTTLSATYATEADRINALSISEGRAFEVSRRLQLPANTQILVAPQPLNLSGGLLTAARTQRLSGDTLIEDFSLTLRGGTVAAALVRTFVKTLQHVDESFLHSTKVDVSRR